MKKYKRLLLMAGLVTLVFVLSACGTAPVSESSTGIWDRYIVYYFAQAIKFLSLGGSVGIGIILFTLVIRIILLPLMHFQTKSMRKTQELQPQLKALQQKYSSKDPETQRLFREEQQRLYAENLAAVFTFASTYLSSMSQLETNASLKIMNYVMPAMIFFMGISLASSLSLYWVVSNAFQTGQTLLLNNPFKIRKEREEAARQAKARERALERAKSPKKKGKKK